MPNNRYRTGDNAELNCFSRFLYAVCTAFVGKVHELTAPFVPKRRKARYDRIMDTILNEDDLKITNEDFDASSRAVRLFIGAVDAIVALITVGIIAVGVVQYFRYLM